MTPVARGNNGLSQGVQDVQTRKIPYAFINVFTEAEKQILENLAGHEIKPALYQALPDVCMFSVEEEITPAIKSAAEVIQRLVAALAEQQFGLNPILSNAQLPWHTDAETRIRGQISPKLRVTVALDPRGANTTQCFVPDEKHYDDVLNATSRTLWQLVDQLTLEGNGTIGQGNRYDLCIFHEGIIHRTPPGGTKERFIVTMTGSEMPPGPFQHSGMFESSIS